MAIDNKDLVRRYVDELNAHSVEGASRYVADNLVNHAAIPEAQGIAGFRRIMAKLFRAFPDGRWTCEDLIAEGDRVVCRMTVTGTQTGPLEFVKMPLPASGKKMRTEQMHIFRVEDGKVAEHWAVRDDLGTLKQLGFLPETGVRS
jgi:steroid delta-isomerase-like uncharacterized protein